MPCAQPSPELTMTVALDHVAVAFDRVEDQPVTSTRSKLAAGTAARAASVLAEHAREIRRIGKRAKDDLIEIGRRLADAKVRAGRGYWLKWLDQEFGWSDKSAERLIDFYRFSQEPIFEFDKLSNLTLPVSAIYLLAAPSTPAEVRTDIVERARSGESLSVNAVACEIKRARAGKKPLPKANSARVTKTATRHDARAWWAAASVDERARFLDGIGAKALAAAIPPGWNMALARAGTSTYEHIRETGRLRQQIAHL